MALIEVNFKSFNERDTVKGWIYIPITEPRAIVQIVHGFGEHSRRYFHMILKFLDAGFVVCADDHVGHGKTAYDSDTWGDFGDKGYMTTIEDEESLRKIVTEKYPDIPFFMFGHSWGSMITRNYAAKYGNNLSGAIICGTIGKMDNALKMREELQKIVNGGQGSKPQPEFSVKLFEGMVDRFDNPNSPNDWISGDPNVVKDHASDPFNNLLNPPTAQSLLDFADAALNIMGTEWAKKIPVKLPLYNIAGDQDPVGDYGEGVYMVSNWLSETGHKNLKTKLYSGYRHEIHNEIDIRDCVVNGIITFIEKNL